MFSRLRPASLLLFLFPCPESASSPAPADPLSRYVSERPPFTVLRPESWKVRYEASPEFFRVWVSDAGLASQVEISLEDNRSARSDSVALLRAKARDLRSRFPDLALTEVVACEDLSCAAATVAFTRERVPFKGRFYFQSDPMQTVIRGYAAPLARLEGERNLMLNILANIRWGNPRSADQPAAARAPQAPPVQMQLVKRRSADGSVSLLLPADWTFQGQSGRVLAVAPEGSVCAGFIFTSFQVIPPQLRIPVTPDVIQSPYLAPSRFLPLVFQKFGNRNMRILQATPDPQAAAAYMQHSRTRCVAEKVVLSWDSPRSQPCLGGFLVFNGQPGVSGIWTSLVAGLWGPGQEIDRYIPVLDQIGKSFGINDQYAANYIREGLDNLRRQQARTQEAMRDLNRAREDNQRAWEARQERKDASNARWDDYRRGNSYWISELEGGKIYQTDPWGTRDTVTGDRWEGAPHDYIRFEGQNPRHPSENMRELSSHEVQKLTGR